MTDCQGTARPMEGDEYKVILPIQEISDYYYNFLLISVSGYIQFISLTNCRAMK